MKQQKKASELLNEIDIRFNKAAHLLHASSKNLPETRCIIFYNNVQEAIKLATKDKKQASKYLKSNLYRIFYSLKDAEDIATAIEDYSDILVERVPHHLLINHEFFKKLQPSPLFYSAKAQKSIR